MIAVRAKAALRCYVTLPDIFFTVLVIEVVVGILSLITVIEIVVRSHCLLS